MIIFQLLLCSRLNQCVTLYDHRMAVELYQCLLAAGTAIKPSLIHFAALQSNLSLSPSLLLSLYHSLFLCIYLSFSLLFPSPLTLVLSFSSNPPLPFLSAVVCDCIQHRYNWPQKLVLVASCNNALYQVVQFVYCM